MKFRKGARLDTGQIDDMHQQPRALDVPQKLHPHPAARMRALDQSWNVTGHKGTFLADRHNTQDR